jgi:hypothetical protein
MTSLQRIATRIQHHQKSYCRPRDDDIYAHLLKFTYKLHSSAVLFGKKFLSIEGDDKNPF